eukprot:CAMPEP_0203946234 /NCGR_PEP_ID=MMETSP0359-20131031/81548_1 /ASSEMBLY_ACC=CAM_ASM_000338 /TAXON_ID=268821 /ORGANISM="Scrippsiella Hangoei, Strain SHTV-5" /LENGTH=194 /DNA_ID=CAMNT_0050877505 /DNA_START=1 /DNA_END=582 /DNA_ORIENTATION=-
MLVIAALLVVLPQLASAAAAAAAAEIADPLPCGGADDDCVSDEACARTRQENDEVGLLLLRRKDQGLCPGSNVTCWANQCCPKCSLSEWKTFPCPISDPSWDECEIALPTLAPTPAPTPTPTPTPTSAPAPAPKPAPMSVPTPGPTPTPAKSGGVFQLFMPSINKCLDGTKTSQINFATMQPCNLGVGQAWKWD